ncbi:hypothetical protein, partial [uncultured Porphyromonas sp.]|uniref:hypothetical protein n=1 Tax=uncultured Porphyromonas sp. TaxID=159274 RepID=UPI0025D96066
GRLTVLPMRREVGCGVNTYVEEYGGVGNGRLPECSSALELTGIEVECLYPGALLTEVMDDVGVDGLHCLSDSM